MKININTALLLALVVACAETGTAPPNQAAERFHDSSNYQEEGDQNAPPVVPPEYQIPTILHEVVPDAGFVNQYAYAQSIIRYFGTNALARAKVTTNVGGETSESETSDLLPANRDHMATVNYYMGTCGGTIDGVAYGKVWNEFPVGGSFLNWGAKSDTKQKSAQCPSGPPGGGGDGEGEPGGGLVCYTLATDYYWYHPDTGQFEYRFTTYETWCEPYTT